MGRRDLSVLLAPMAQRCPSDRMDLKGQTDQMDQKDLLHLSVPLSRSDLMDPRDLKDLSLRSVPSRL